MARVPKYRGYPDFFYKGDVSLSYADYLQEREFSDSITYEITEQTKSLITNSDRALSAQIHEIRTARDAQVGATYEVKESLDSLRNSMEQGFAQVGSILEWGFTDLIAASSRMNDLLEDILRTLKTPSQTWAYEQFERARDENRRLLFEEALESLDRAINGLGGNVGNKTEYRFRYLRGMIYLGNLKNNSHGIIDVKKAEEEFILAARYSEIDFPREAATALLCASRAANIQGKYTKASNYARDGLKFHRLAGLSYELAKSLVNLGDFEGAAICLKDAIRIDKGLALKAAGEGDFKRSEHFINGVLRDLKEEAANILRNALGWIIKSRDSYSKVNYYWKSKQKLFHIYEVRDLRPLVDEWVLSSDQLMASGGLLDIREHLEKVPDIVDRLSKAGKYFSDRVSQEIDGEASRIERDARKQSEEIKKAWDFADEPLAYIAVIFVIGLTIWEFFAGYPAISVNGGPIDFGAVFWRVVLSAFILVGGLVGVFNLPDALKDLGRSHAGSAWEARILHANDVRREAQSVRASDFLNLDRNICDEMPNWAMGGVKVIF